MKKPQSVSIAKRAACNSLSRLQHLSLFLSLDTSLGSLLFFLNLTPHFFKKNSQERVCFKVSDAGFVFLYCFLFSLFTQSYFYPYTNGLSEEAERVVKLINVFVVASCCTEKKYMGFLTHPCVFVSCAAAMHAVKLRIPEIKVAC